MLAETIEEIEEETGLEVGARDVEFTVEAGDVAEEEEEELDTVALDEGEADAEVEELDEVLEGLVLLEDDGEDDDDDGDDDEEELEELLLLVEELLEELVLLEDEEVEREVEELVVEVDEVVAGVEEASGSSELLLVSDSSFEVLLVSSTGEDGVSASLEDELGEAELGAAVATSEATALLLTSTAILRDLAREYNTCLFHDPPRSCSACSCCSSTCAYLAVAKFAGAESVPCRKKLEVKVRSRSALDESSEEVRILTIVFLIGQREEREENEIILLASLVASVKCSLVRASHFP